MNTQPIEKASDSSELEIVKVWETIQGEGPFAGHPSVFVRLAGCNLQCPVCDTDYTSNRRFVTPPQLLHEVWQQRKSGLVVFTGGEPFRQKNIARYLVTLVRNGYRIQVETNGTFDCPSMLVMERVTVVCSPKSPALNQNFIPLIDAWKYVVQAGHIADDGLPTDTLGNNTPVARPPKGLDVPIYVQPLDEQDPVKNQRNIDAAVESCMKFGYILSLQTHKYLGME